MSKTRQTELWMWLLCGLISIAFICMAATAIIDQHITTTTKYGTVSTEGGSAVVLGFIFLAFGIGIWDLVTSSIRYKNLIRLGMLLIWLSTVGLYAVLK
jgi:hypothetical protein